MAQEDAIVVSANRWRYGSRNQRSRWERLQLLLFGALQHVALFKVGARYPCVYTSGRIRISLSYCPRQPKLLFLSLHNLKTAINVEKSANQNKLLFANDLVFITIDFWGINWNMELLIQHFRPEARKLRKKMAKIFSQELESMKLFFWSIKFTTAGYVHTLCTHSLGRVRGKWWRPMLPQWLVHWSQVTSIPRVVIGWVTANMGVNHGGTGGTCPPRIWSGGGDANGTRPPRFWPNQCLNFLHLRDLLTSISTFISCSSFLMSQYILLFI